MYAQVEKRLNLVHSSPSFCLRVLIDGSMEVVQLERIPNDKYEYWVHATVTFACGETASSVFCVGAGGGEHHAIKIRIGDRWFDSDSPELIDALGMSHDQVFPFDWSYSIPVANDIYHPT